MLARCTGKCVRVLGGLGIKLDVFQEFFNTPGCVFWRTHYDSSACNGKGRILRQLIKNLAIFDVIYQAQIESTGNTARKVSHHLNAHSEDQSDEENCQVLM